MAPYCQIIHPVTLALQQLKDISRIYNMCKGSERVSGRKVTSFISGCLGIAVLMSFHDQFQTFFLLFQHYYQTIG